MRALIVLSLAVAGCASTDPAPPASPPSPSTPSTAVVSSASPPAAAGKCFATIARARPEGWINTGKVVVLILDGWVTIIEIHDASGKVGPPAPIEHTSLEALWENLHQAICMAGGVLGFPSEKLPSTGIGTFDVFRPAKEDTAGDLTLLCSEPKGMPSDLDRSQRVALAHKIYNEQLTSARYRGWLHHADTALERNTADQARSFAILAADAKAAGKSSCWFVDVRRK